jgi:hypothetical protein
MVWLRLPADANRRDSPAIREEAAFEGRCRFDGCRGRVFDEIRDDREEYPAAGLSASRPNRLASEAFEALANETSRDRLTG